MSKKFKPGDKVMANTGLRGEVLRAFRGKILLRFDTPTGQTMTDWFSIRLFSLT